MKKALLLICVLALALGITYLVLHKGNSGNDKPEPRDLPLIVNSKTSGFNRSFAGVLNSYYLLAADFVNNDSLATSASAQKLSLAIDSIHFDQLKADTSIVQTAVSLAGSIQGDLKGLTGEKAMEQKKREFNMITDELYSLIRTVRYDGSIVYHMRSPTAFSDSSEGYWLSPANQISNPYFGKNHPVYKDKMLSYGEISDSIHFSAPVNP
jgi:hypothetical protein